MNISKSSFAFFICLSLTACQKQPAQPVDGRAYYQALNCRVCHRIGEEGGRGGPDLSYVGFRRNREWLNVWLKDPQGWKKDTAMPNPRLSETARQVLVEYLLRLKGQAFDQNTPWNKPLNSVERGHIIYGRAGCIACHGKAGVGGYPNNNVPGGLIPALNNAAQTFTKEELKKKIHGGSKPKKADPKGPDPMVFMPAWGKVLKEDEIDAVSDYLFSLKSKTSQETNW